MALANPPCCASWPAWTRTFIEIIREAFQPIVDLLVAYNEINATFSEPDADVDTLIEKQGRIQEELDKADSLLSTE